jgi:hypothetical protein
MFRDQIWCKDNLDSKVHNILATPSLLYGCEILILKQRDIRRIKRAEMKFKRGTTR